MDIKSKIAALPPEIRESLVSSLADNGLSILDDPPDPLITVVLAQAQMARLMERRQTRRFLWAILVFALINIALAFTPRPVNLDGAILKVKNSFSYKGEEYLIIDLIRR